MNTYRVTVYPEKIVWEGEAINCTDALLKGRANADPDRWESYMNRPSGSHSAPPSGLFSRWAENIYGSEPIQCKVERIR